MNDKLRDLAQQADFCGEDLKNTVFGTCTITAIEYLHALIVQECIDCAHRNGDNVDYLKEQLNIKS